MCQCASQIPSGPCVVQIEAEVDAPPKKRLSNITFAFAPSFSGGRFVSKTGVGVSPVGFHQNITLSFVRKDTPWDRPFATRTRQF